MESLELVPSKWRIAFDVLQWTFFAWVLACLALHMTNWIGIIFQLSFALAVVALITLAFLLLRKQRPQVTLDRLGIEDKTSGVGPIPWQEIAAIELDKKRNRIIVKLKDQDAWIAALPEPQKNVAKLLISIKQPPFALNLNYLPASGKEILQRLKDAKRAVDAALVGHPGSIDHPI